MNVFGFLTDLFARKSSDDIYTSLENGTMNYETNVNITNGMNPSMNDERKIQWDDCRTEPKIVMRNAKILEYEIPLHSKDEKWMIDDTHMWRRQSIRMNLMASIGLSTLKHGFVYKFDRENIIKTANNYIKSHRVDNPNDELSIRFNDMTNTNKGTSQYKIVLLSGITAYTYYEMSDDHIISIKLSFSSGIDEADDYIHLIDSSNKNIKLRQLPTIVKTTEYERTRDFITLYSVMKHRIERMSMTQCLNNLDDVEVLLREYKKETQDGEIILSKESLLYTLMKYDPCVDPGQAAYAEKHILITKDCYESLKKRLAVIFHDINVSHVPDITMKVKLESEYNDEFADTYLNISLSVNMLIDFA